MGEEGKNPTNQLVMFLWILCYLFINAESADDGCASIMMNSK